MGKIKEIKESMNEVCWVCKDDPDLILTHGENFTLLCFSLVGLGTAVYLDYKFILKGINWVFDKIDNWKSSEKEDKEEDPYGFNS